MIDRCNLSLLIFVTFILTGCQNSRNWDWQLLNPNSERGFENIRFLISGLWHSVSISVLAAVISVVISLLVVIPAFSKFWYIRATNRIYVEFVRSIPILPFLFWIYYGVPIMSKGMGIEININSFYAAVIALAISDSAFTAEIYRAGVQSVSKNQVDGARALGLRRRQTFRLVILPQALRMILPALANQFVYIVKISAFASVIGVEELTRKANELATSTFRPLEIYTFLILEYLVLVLCISYIVRRFEARYSKNFGTF